MAVIKTTFELSEETVVLLAKAQGGMSRVAALEKLLWSHPKLVRIVKRLRLKQPIRPKNTKQVRHLGPGFKQRKLF